MALKLVPAQGRDTTALRSPKECELGAVFEPWFRELTTKEVESPTHRLRVTFENSRLRGTITEIGGAKDRLQEGHHAGESSLFRVGAPNEPLNVAKDGKGGKGGKGGMLHVVPRHFTCFLPGHQGLLGLLPVWRTCRTSAGAQHIWMQQTSRAEYLDTHQKPVGIEVKVDHPSRGLRIKGNHVGIRALSPAQGDVRRIGFRIELDVHGPTPSRDASQVTVRLLGRYLNSATEADRISRLHERASSSNVERESSPIARGPVRLTKEQNDKIEALYKSGWRPADIARTLGTTEWTVHHRLNRLGVRRRPVSMTDAEIQEARRLNDEGVPITELTKRFNRSWKTIWKELRLTRGL